VDVARERRWRGDAPGILTLLVLIRRHRGAYEFDWRTRFGVPLSDVPERMSWGEAVRLSRELAHEPTSHVAAALAGWEYPVSREWVALRAVHARLGGKKDHPLPAPWERASKIRGESLSIDAYRERRAKIAEQSGR
jgi:hypothetical protein